MSTAPRRLEHGSAYAVQMLRERDNSAWQVRCPPYCRTGSRLARMPGYRSFDPERRGPPATSIPMTFYPGIAETRPGAPFFFTLYTNKHTRRSSKMPMQHRLVLSHRQVALPKAPGQCSAVPPDLDSGGRMRGLRQDRGAPRYCQLDLNRLVAIGSSEGTPSQRQLSTTNGRPAWE